MTRGGKRGGNNNNSGGKSKRGGNASNRGKGRGGKSSQHSNNHAAPQIDSKTVQSNQQALAVVCLIFETTLCGCLFLQIIDCCF
jgi:hypothetical protein